MTAEEMDRALRAALVSLRLAGAGRVRRALIGGRLGDYWELNYAETVEFLRDFLSAAFPGTDFQMRRYRPDWNDRRLVVRWVGGPSLRAVAEAVAGLPARRPRRLRELGDGDFPVLLRGFVDIEGGALELAVDWVYFRREEVV